jgi:predicted dehydrogenase
VSAATGRPARIAILGAGNRGGDVYAPAAAAAPELVRVVALADPREARRRTVGERSGVPPERRYDHWRALLGDAAAGRLELDAVVVATPDADHVEPTEAALALGLDVLLEKPIAPDGAGVQRIAAAAERGRGRVTVAHVLRHAPVFERLALGLRDGALGRLVGIDHVEHVGHWHFAHSYVRGAWRREADASPMLLAKACHDLDLLRWWVGERCERVTSTAALRHFRSEEAPAGAPARCTDGCPVEATCPYGAPRIYLGRYGARAVWPNLVLTAEPSEASVLEALRTGPYGRCVYRCDNDVVDHQVVALEFAGGVRASLTVTAFTAEMTRTVRAWGTHGEVAAHFGRGTLEWHDFRTGARRLEDCGASGEAHDAADRALARDWFERVAGVHGDDPGATDLAASLESHLIAFAAERARREGRWVEPRI